MSAFTMILRGAVVLSLGAASCAVSTDGDSADTELAQNTSDDTLRGGEPEFGVDTVAFDTSWVEGPFTWSQGQSNKQLRPVETHHCVLTRVNGDFDGGGEEVKVYQSGGYWFLGGQSQQQGVGGKAYCFVKSKFLANGSARWSSGDDIWVTAQSGGCYGWQGEAWWGDATTHISGVSGKLDGSGDRIFVTQSSGAFTPSILRADTCDGFVRGRAHSFFAGTPSSGVLAKYWSVGEYVADSALHCTVPGSLSGNGDYEVAMAPVNDAMCHFTRIGDGGNWGGGGEYVDIYPKMDAGGIERWYLRAHSGYCGNDRRTVARARCYKRDQR